MGKINRSNQRAHKIFMCRFGAQGKDIENEVQLSVANEVRTAVSDDTSITRDRLCAF